MECRSCGSNYLWPFLDLGNQAIPRFPTDPKEEVPHFPLSLVKCESCNLVQLSESVDRDLLFKQFWYRSGTSQAIREDLKGIAIEGSVEVDEKGIALDIGCNDGTLLSFLPESMKKVGFEPALNVAIPAQKHGRILNDYFSADQYLPLFQKANLVTCIGMFYDLEDPLWFCKNVAECLAPEGIFIVQQNYLGLMLVNTGYDNVCHEHLTYFSLASLEPILEKAGLEVYDVDLNEINGGSFKTFIAHRGKREVSDDVRRLREDEKKQGLDGRKAYRDFSYKVRTRARELNRFLLDKGNLMLYGAGTRGSTLFQYASMYNPINPRGAVDNNPEKHGRFYLDRKIPIMSAQEALKNPPEYFLLLAYQFTEEIVKNDQLFPKTKWIIPLPEFRIV